MQTRGRGHTRACLSPGAPVPRSPPPRPQECAGAGPEAAAAPRVSWAQLSHIRPGPAGRSRAWDAPVPATRPEGGTLSQLWGAAMAGAGRWRRRAGVGLGPRGRDGVRSRLSFPPRPRGWEEVRLSTTAPVLPCNFSQHPNLA